MGGDVEKVPEFLSVMGILNFGPKIGTKHLINLDLTQDDSILFEDL